MLKPLPEKGCQVCQRPLKKDGSCGNPICDWENRYFDSNRAIAYRRGELERTISLYKGSDKRGWAIIFARLLVAYLDKHREEFAPFAVLVASPTFVSSSGEGRRFDHTRLVLAHAHAIAGDRWPFDVGDPPAIVKTAHTPRMALRSNWQERWQIAEYELPAVLSVARPEVTRGRAILVYEDIFTDGLTLRSVARCLIEEGEARSVSTITLARQPWTRRGGASREP